MYINSICVKSCGVNDAVSSFTKCLNKWNVKVSVTLTQPDTGFYAHIRNRKESSLIDLHGICVSPYLCQNISLDLLKTAFCLFDIESGLSHFSCFNDGKLMNLYNNGDNGFELIGIDIEELYSLVENSKLISVPQGVSLRDKQNFAFSGLFLKNDLWDIFTESVNFSTEVFLKLENIDDIPMMLGYNRDERVSVGMFDLMLRWDRYRVLPSTITNSYYLRTYFVWTVDLIAHEMEALDGLMKLYHSEKNRNYAWDIMHKIKDIDVLLIFFYELGDGSLFTERNNKEDILPDIYLSALKEVRPLMKRVYQDWVSLKDMGLSILKIEDLEDMLPMSNKEVCKSCCDPLDKFNKKDIIKEGFCPSCVNEVGDLSSYGNILDGMLEDIAMYHPEVGENDRLKTAQRWLSKGEVWKDKFVEENVMIDSYRNQNLSLIPKHRHEGFEHSCAECMYYQGCDDSTEKHEDWLMRMQKKYGDCGNLVYYNGKLVGFVQYAPKKEFSRLDELETGSTNSDSWYISCIYVDKSVSSKTKERIVVLLLRYILRSLKNRGVTTVEISAPIKKDTISSNTFTWDFYQEYGFTKKGRDDKYVVGYMKL